MSVYVVRAFIRIREQLVANSAILKCLAEIDKTLLREGDLLVYSECEELARHSLVI